MDGTVTVRVERTDGRFVAVVGDPPMTVTARSLSGVLAVVRAALAFDRGSDDVTVTVLLGAGHLGRLGRIAAVQDQLVAAARAVGAFSVALAGSVARGDDGAASDIDVLVDVDLGPHGLWPALDLRVALADLLPGERVDVVPLDALRDDVRQRMLVDAVALAG